MRAVWENLEFDDRDVDKLVKSLQLSPVVAKILCARKVATEEKVAKFFENNFRDISSPFSIKNMLKAAQMIAEYVKNKKRILIFGDYDVDGASATSILYRILKEADANVYFFIPHRLDDGYGLSEENIERIYADNFYDLIVTVDCGITSHDAIANIQHRGAKVIITDHHLCVGTLPTPEVLVNPKLEEGSENEDLCGAAVAFKLAWAIAVVISDSDQVLPKFRKALTSSIALVAIATVADVMPLLGENRLFVVKGLEMMRDQQNYLFPGLRKLMEMCRLLDGKISCNDISFKIAPRLNAAGRMADANIVVDLLCCADEQEVGRIANKLELLNQERKVLCEQLCEEVEGCLKADPDFHKRHIFVVADRNWHKGVIGVVAARMAERYHRPVIVCSMDENNNWCGSARTNGDIDIKAALDECSDILFRYGGHKGAAGLAVSQENFREFLVRIEAAVGKRCEDERPQQHISIDCEAHHEELTLNLARELSRFEPYGEANRRPVILVRGLYVDKMRKCGNAEKHLKMSFYSRQGAILEAMAFNLGHKMAEIDVEKSYDIVCFPMVNEWNRTPTLDLMIDDIRLSEENDI